jgi:L-arabinose isomerase
LQIEMLEVDEISGYRAVVEDAARTAKIAEFRETFSVGEDCLEEELAQAAETSVALARLTWKKDLERLAYYCKGSEVDANEDTVSSIILGA